MLFLPLLVLKRESISLLEKALCFPQGGEEAKRSLPDPNLGSGTARRLAGVREASGESAAAAGEELLPWRFSGAWDWAEQSFEAKRMKRKNQNPGRWKVKGVVPAIDHFDTNWF